MLRLVILSVLLISSAIARPQEAAAATEINKDSTTTVEPDTEAPATSGLVVTEVPASSITQTAATTTQSPATTPRPPSPTTTTTEKSSGEDGSSESTEDDGSHEIPLVPITPPRRKVLYINQQQSGKLNVHLELNDVSLIVIPNKKDPQLSLLNLLLRSAQKSNLKHQHNEEEKKKEESAKLSVQHNHQDDDYSHNYKMDNYMHASLNEPTIESRAPYRVDITSTLGQQPVVDIKNNGKFQSQGEFARSPMVKLMKPISVQSHGRIFKRSIDTGYLRFNPDVLDDSSISQNDSDEEEEQELINSLESNQNINGVENQEDLESAGSGGGGGSEFVLLGAVEDCGHGRRRNSYMICVAIDE